MHARLPRLLAVPAILAAAPVLAHPGHVESVAGHSHWLAIGAAGAACLVAAVAAGRFLARRRAVPPQQAE